MREANFAIITNAAMNVTTHSTPVLLKQIFGGAIQAYWTGTPVGVLTIQVSNDIGLNQFGLGVVNWSEVTGTEQDPNGTPDTFGWNLSGLMFRWARLSYVPTSSNGVLNATVNLKGV